MRIGALSFVLDLANCRASCCDLIFADRESSPRRLLTHCCDCVRRRTTAAAIGPGLLKFSAFAPRDHRTQLLAEYFTESPRKATERRISNFPLLTISLSLSIYIYIFLSTLSSSPDTFENDAFADACEASRHLQERFQCGGRSIEGLKDG